MYPYWKNMEYIKKLCDEHDVKLSFFYVNKIGNPVKHPKYVDRIKAIAPIWHAPDSLFHTVEYYVDPAHFNRKGTEAMTPYLLRHLEQYDY